MTDVKASLSEELRMEWFINAGDPQPMTYEQWLETQLLRLRSFLPPDAAGERIYTRADVEAMIAAALAAKQMRANQAERLQEFNKQTDQLIASCTASPASTRGQP